MFHPKTLKMGRFELLMEKAKKMTNEISVHLTIRSSGRLLHYVIV